MKVLHHGKENVRWIAGHRFHNEVFVERDLELVKEQRAY
jgi:hypothetical protein